MKQIQVKNPKNKIKLPNKFGSISYLGKGRRNPFMLRAPTTYDKFGKAHRKVIGYIDDYFKGMEILIKYNENPNHEDKKKLTIEQIYILWSQHEQRNFEEYKKKNPSARKKRAYAQNYDSTYNQHYKQLYKTPILDIHAKDIQDIINNAELGKTGSKYIKLLFSKLLTHAKYLGLDVDFEILDLIVLPIEEKKESKHIDFTPKQIEILWDNIGNKNIDPHQIIDSILISIYLGTRPEELLDIEKDKINLNENKIVGGSKTQAGIDREMPINNKIKPLIEARMKKVGKYLIAKENGSQFNYRHYLDVFKNTTKKLYGKSHLPHDTRDTTATLLYNAKVDKLIIKHILGHSTKGDVTEHHYIKITFDQKLEAINKI